MAFSAHKFSLFISGTLIIGHTHRQRSGCLVDNVGAASVHAVAWGQGGGSTHPLSPPLTLCHSLPDCQQRMPQPGGLKQHKWMFSQSGG